MLYAVAAELMFEHNGERNYAATESVGRGTCAIGSLFFFLVGTGSITLSIREREASFMDSLYNWNDATKIGVALTGFGSFFTCLGVMFFLDSALLTMGNLLFVAGIAMVMGPARCKAFFLEKKRLRASACFFTGIVLVMIGWCFIGLVIQGFGGLNLFGNFFPMIARVLESLPVVGSVMQLTPVQMVLERLDLGRRRSV